MFHPHVVKCSTNHLSVLTYDMWGHSTEAVYGILAKKDIFKSWCFILLTDWIQGRVCAEVQLLKPPFFKRRSARWETKKRLGQNVCVCHTTHMCGFWKEGGVGMGGNLDVGFTGGLAKFSLRAFRFPGGKNRDKHSRIPDNMHTRLDLSNWRKS